MRDAAVPSIPRRQGAAAFAALRHHDFRLYFVTSLLSMMGDNVEHVISYWMIFQAFHSPALAGFAVMSHWAPFLLFGIYIGSLADRYDCRKIILISQLAFIGASLAWAVLFLAGALQTWHAAVILVVHGFAGATWSPAGQLILHDIVGRDHLQSAIRLNSTGRQLGILFGPAVGGALLLFLGPAYGLLASALLYLPMTLWALRTSHTGHVREDVGVMQAPRLGLGDALRTFRDVSSNRAIFTMVALVGLSSLLIGNAFQAQMPQFATAFTTAQGEVAYSALLAANAAGAVLGGVILESSSFFRQPRVRSAVLLAILWSLAMGVFAVAPSYLVAVLALLAAGVLNLGFSSIAQTLVQLEAPANRRGRVVGLFNMSQLGLRVGSGMTIGVLGGFIGIHASLGLSAGALLIVCLGLLAWTSSGMRRRARSAA